MAHRTHNFHIAPHLIRWRKVWRIHFLFGWHCAIFSYWRLCFWIQESSEGGSQWTQSLHWLGLAWQFKDRNRSRQVPQSWIWPDLGETSRRCLVNPSVPKQACMPREPRVPCQGRPHSEEAIASTNCYWEFVFGPASHFLFWIGGWRFASAPASCSPRTPSCRNRSIAGGCLCELDFSERYPGATSSLAVASVASDDVHCQHWLHGCDSVSMLGTYPWPVVQDREHVARKAGWHGHQHRWESHAVFRGLTKVSF